MFYTKKKYNLSYIVVATTEISNIGMVKFLKSFKNHHEKWLTFRGVGKLVSYMPWEGFIDELV